MINQLTVTLLQANLVWENATQNCKNFEDKITAINEPTDIVVLPEMFATGFSMHPEKLAESMNGSTVDWMKKLAMKVSVVICGSLIIKENNQYYNRFLFVQPDGKIHQYDKKHLFTLAGEHHAYTAGNEKVIISYKGWKICPVVCYDLRFPVWVRNTENYDVLLYVANWPKPRVNAWDALLKARAIENMSYVIGVNRVGEDANNLAYSGSSQVIDYLGNNICTTALNQEETTSVVLDYDQQQNARKKFNFLNDQDAFNIV